MEKREKNEDIREILIRHVNHRFKTMKVESLLAYKIALYLILTAKTKGLYRKDCLILEFESLNDFAKKFAEFEDREEVRSKSSIKTAIDKLGKAAVVMSISQRPTKDAVEIGALKNVQYLFLYMDLNSLKEEYPDTIYYDYVEIELFDTYKRPIIDELLALSESDTTTLPLLAVQIGLYLILSLTKEDLLAGESDFLVSTYNEFSEYFSTFIDIFEIPQSTISDNIDALHNSSFINISKLNPYDAEDTFEKIDPTGYGNHDHHFIEFYYADLLPS